MSGHGIVLGGGFGFAGLCLVLGIFTKTDSLLWLGGILGSVLVVGLFISMLYGR